MPTNRVKSTAAGSNTPRRRPLKDNGRTSPKIETAANRATKRKNEVTWIRDLANAGSCNGNRRFAKSCTDPCERSGMLFDDTLA